MNNKDLDKLIAIADLKVEIKQLNKINLTSINRDIAESIEKLIVASEKLIELS